MKGLKTQESNKFIEFMKIIQNEALKQDKTFFLDSGLGNEFETDKIEGEELQGWLIQNKDIEAFEKEWRNDEVNDDTWGEFFCFVRWSKQSNKIEVDFD